MNLYTNHNILFGQAPYSPKQPTKLIKNNVQRYHLMSKKKTDYKSIKIFNIAFSLVISLFFIYEYTVVKNPFMDPFAPNIVWGALFAATTALMIRMYIAISKT
ncbi:MAG: hypothetical protein ACRCTQ_02035 [Brevinemataceae bacterium]